MSSQKCSQAVDFIVCVIPAKAGIQTECELLRSIFRRFASVTPLNSRLPYAVVKNVGESFCRSYQQEFGLDFTLFRFFNTYGPKQSPDFVVARFIDAALAGRYITVYGDGQQTRTFCYIDDNANDKAITVLELAQTIIQLTGSTSKIVHLPPLPEGDMTRRQPDIQNMKQLLKRDFTSLEEGLNRIIALKKNNK